MNTAQQSVERNKIFGKKLWIKVMRYVSNTHLNSRVPLTIGNISANEHVSIIFVTGRRKGSSNVSASISPFDIGLAR